MKVYQTIDGTLIGFYHEAGTELQCVTFQDLYEQQLVTKERQEEITIPGYYEEYDIVTPGFWKEEEVYVQGHYELQMVWHPEYSVTRYREVPGHYEIQNIWVPEYTVTRYYWREAHPARGLEAAWIPYEETIPAGFKDQRVWVNTYTEEYQELMPAGEKETRVWVEGEFVTERTWVEETTRTERVWVPPSKDYVTVEYQVLEEVYVGRQAVFSSVDPAQATTFTVEDLIPAPVDQTDVEDIITIRNVLTGDVLRTTATYLGMATRIDDNEFILP